MDRGNPALHEMDRHDPDRLMIQAEVTEGQLLKARALLADGYTPDEVRTLCGFVAAQLAIPHEIDDLERYPKLNSTKRAGDAA